MVKNDSGPGYLHPIDRNLWSFNIMNLSYRGIPYVTDVPNVTMTDSKLRVQYRGAVYTYRRPLAIPVLQPVFNLCYRGVEYHTDGSPVDSQVVIPQPTLQQMPAAFQVRQQQLQGIEQVHLASIRRSVEQRLMAARAKGNEKLVLMLEAELQQFA